MKRRYLLSIAASLSVLTTFPFGVIAEDGHNHGHEEGEEGHEHGHEDHLELSAETLAAQNIQIETAAPQDIKVTLPLKGQIVASEDRVAHVIPRFGGIIKEVRKRLGERVEKGETLAVIESNQNLQRYEVQALLSGIVVKRHASLGEYASDSTEIFEVADLSEVFADFAVFSPDFGKVKTGQGVLLHVPDREKPIETSISFLSPLVDAATQSKLARAAIGNTDNSLMPGMYVRGAVVIDQFKARLAVDASAPQTIGGETVLFVQEGEKLEPRSVALGRTDGLYTEILSGIEPGARYARGNTFVLKAELGKGEAEHEH